jgi:peptidoglycan/LPS O-acetylase OafA/YrhL
MAHRFAAIFYEDRSHFRVLTGIRGWAAIWVYLYHLWVYAQQQIILSVAGLSINLTPFLCIGGAGVSIFFVLSGFLLGMPFAQWQAGLRHRPKLGRFFSRRVARVFPAYYAQLAILSVIAYWIPGQPGVADGATLIRHLLMLFMSPPLGTQPLNGVWWTLPIEFSFYLLLPLIGFMLRPKYFGLLLGASLLLMGAWRHYTVLWLAASDVPARVIASYQLPGSLDMFGFGMLAAVLHVNRGALPDWLLPKVNSTRMALLGLALVVAAIYWLNYHGENYWADNPIFYLWTPALSLGVAALILAGMDGNRFVGWLFGNRYMVFLGLVSYSLYLWHFPVLSWLAGVERLQAWPMNRLLALLLVSLPPVLLVSALSYALVERPFMRMGRNRGR